MAKRTKKQEKQLEEVIKGSLILLALATYLYTKSIGITILVTFITIGLIIAFTINRVMKRKKILRNSGIFEIDKMDGIQFEHYLKELFINQGYKVEVTSASGDFGADLILKKDNNKIVVQAKRFSKSVGVKAIQEVKASQNYYNANESWVVTNNYFTSPAEKLALSNNVKLIDREELIKLITAMNLTAIPSVNYSMLEVASTKLKCEKCGNDLVLRKSTRGRFYGCSTYPKCRNTKEYKEQQTV
ncbi:restriction endonuclease [Bacillus sp. S/N-304-OC-R1]|uniref:restriction endonuclease n=1 Tax=Bacillus sp. S/N-304-OC-R1 TaxID=2758034 RepID=UPI001C8F0988|nr:restriction endonuclease [Bacillus sp. S/N-304-OC-R1]MBY0120924.1 restriction endonuclease [Bacillus sp. S/N-304-OC-R1]